MTAVPNGQGIRHTGKGPDFYRRYFGMGSEGFTLAMFGQVLKSGPGTGYVDFPTKGIINPAEGTVEMWVCPLDWTLSDPYFHVFFDIRKGDGLLCLYKFTAMVGLLMLSSEYGGAPNYSCCYQTTWKTGEWHHITGTWSAKAVGGMSLM